MRLVRIAAPVILAIVVVAPASATSVRARGPWRVLRVGQSIVLLGDPGYYGTMPRIRLTLLKVVDPVRSPAYRARSGTRFVAFRLRFTNLGKSRWSTIPPADAELVDTVGNTYTSVSIMYGSRVQPWPVLRPDLNHGLQLRSAESWTGYLGWVVLTSTRVREFHYAIPGSLMGVWRIRR